MSRQFQFVAISNPMEPVSSESRKLKHSHATRQAHAKERRLRTQRYQMQVTQVRAGEDLAVFDPCLPSPLLRMPNHGMDPFSTLARSLSSQEYFLLDHYVRIVVPYSATHCGLFDYPGDHQAQILRDWVSLAITDGDFLDAAILLSACRSILRARPGDPVLTQMALQYKQRSLKRLRQAIGGVSSPVSLLTVATALALACDEEVSGKIRIARQHLQGVFAMAELSGGPQSLGLTGLLEQMYCRFVVVRELGDMELVSLCRARH